MRSISGTDKGDLFPFDRAVNLLGDEQGFGCFNHDEFSLRVLSVNSCANIQIFKVLCVADWYQWSFWNSVKNGLVIING